VLDILGIFLMGTFHEGEKKMQALAGVSRQADQLSGMVQSAMPPAAVRFLTGQRMAVVTTIDKDGAIWVSAIVGEPGFIYPISPEQLIVDAHTLPASDVLWHNLAPPNNHSAGMVVINFGQRRRLRLNGTTTADGQFLILAVAQTYSNCPKYIQKRELVQVLTAADRDKVQSSQSAALDEKDKSLIASSDTFFIGTYAQNGGADASHRGGQPGFVQVIDDGRIRFPDYSGNNMFNTLGNLALNPRLGLLFIDYQSGNTLQVTGWADAIQPFAWHNGEREGHIDVLIDQVIRTGSGPAGKWQFSEYSPYNPRV
jgi:uncharacterized protein